MEADRTASQGMLARVAGWADGLRHLSGWRRAGFLTLLGALAATGHAPIHAVPLTAVALIVLVWMLDGDAALGEQRLRRTFFTGWWFGFGYFLAGLYWIVLSFLVVSPALGAVSPLAALGLSAGFAIFAGLTALIHIAPGIRGPGRVLWFAVAWTAMEWLRGTILTGFPWNLAAYLWPGIVIGQAGAWLGAYGLSLVTVAILVGPSAFLTPGHGGLRPDRTAGIAATLAACVVLTLLATAGLARLNGAGPTEYVPDVRLRLVQPSIPQHEKWKAEFRARNFRAYLDMTRQDGFADITHVIWPETAAAMFLAEHPEALQAIADVTPPGGVVITGTVQREITASGRRLFNSLYAVDPQGRIVASYDKVHLVPFGEYMPLSSILPFGKITGGGANFSSGPGLRVLNLPGLPPASPLICYEIIFPGEVVAPAAPGRPEPRWLLNLTNDAWFGTSSGPYQHLAAARMRAIEQGLPLVRAANTGVSAIIDSYGRTVASIGLEAVGVVDAGLPAAPDDQTAFARWGYWPGAIVLALVLAICFIFRRESRI